MILKILVSFIENEIPKEVFDKAVSTNLFEDNLPLMHISKNAFANFLYGYAARIRKSYFNVKDKE